MTVRALDRRISRLPLADCGHCLQLTVRLALEAGVERRWVKATLDGGSNLPENLQDIYDFATSVASYQMDDPVLSERVGSELDKAQLIELGVCVATAVIFPTLKRALGYTVTCSLVGLEL